MTCRITGILDMEGKPLNIPTVTWILELEEKIEKLKHQIEQLTDYNPP